MSSFELPVEKITLVFEGGPLEGLEIDTRRELALDPFMELTAKFNAAVDKKTGWPPVHDLMTWFAETVILGWNLQEHGEPVPFSAQAFTTRFTAGQGLAVVGNYVTSVTRVSRPLSRRSRSGSTSKGRKASPSPQS